MTSSARARCALARSARAGLATLAGLLALSSCCATAVARTRTHPRTPRRPAPLSAQTSHAPIDSSYGSGSFGTWGVDPFGLPDYRYTLDEQTAPQAAQPELDGNRDAWHQIGNDRVVADAFNHGYVQLWSQDRSYQWTNFYDASADHFSGGYGYVNLAGHVYSTLYPDRAPDETVTRTFGAGYAQTDATMPGLTVSARVYAPFGNDPLLLHDVTLTNTSSATESPTWFEYWDVNPAMPPANTIRSTASPVYDAGTQTLSVAQLPSAQDTQPLSIFAAALSAPVAGYDTDTQAFFGSGSRADPAAVSADRSSASIAPISPGGVLPGDAMFAFRSPVTLAPGQSITLRYAYGYAHPQQIAPLVARYRGDGSAFTASEAQWRAYVPQVNLGRSYTWLSREAQWDAYMLRSDATDEECAGEHILSQGGYYQYGFGIQAAFRDPLQLMLPMIYEDPGLAREVILYSAQEQSQGIDTIPYARISNCQRFDLGTSDDLDLWLLLAAEEYGLATRDLSFFNTQVPWATGSQASLWAHLQQAFAHQESMHGPHGDYLTGATGDWSDLATEELQMTESSLVTAQATYIYPRLAELADLRHDTTFASQLRAAGAADAKTLAGEWTGRGWYARGWSGTSELGSGAIFEEPQPWAILGGVPSASRATTLVANIRRFLTGIGAPGGPSKIGSAQSPAADDPEVTEHSEPPGSQGNAVFVGGVWYALNGWLTWALGSLQGIVPGAVGDAFSELTRNTLAAHATAFPNSWDGILSVDDACHAWYAPDPSQCGVGLSTSYDTQIPHQDAWTLWDLIELAGISSSEDGFRIVPHLPMSTFDVRFQGAGIASRPGLLRGYIRPRSSGPLVMEVAPPPRTKARHLVAFADGKRVRSRVEHGLVRFVLPASAGRAANWALERAS
jgi:hypothetical protein